MSRQRRTIRRHVWVGQHCLSELDMDSREAEDGDRRPCSCKRCVTYTGGAALDVRPICKRCEIPYYSEDCLTAYCGAVEFRCGSCGREWSTTTRPQGCIFPMCGAPNCDLSPKP